jgi:hypothetical protein
MSDHSFVRVVAALREAGQVDTASKLYLLCGIDENEKILSGEWFGYTQNGAFSYPFILKTGSGELFFGWDEHYMERTNIGGKAIQPQNMFTVSGAEDGEEWESTYQIISVCRYDDVLP